MRNFLMYFVGTSGSGKTTIATELEYRLNESTDIEFQFIDGDVIREEFGGVFGYTYEERMTANKCVCVVCSYLLRHNVSVLLAQVGAYEKMRSQVKSVYPEGYIEVYIKCSFEECERRDVKGYYKKARKGKIDNLNGANDSFEVPKDSDIVIDTEKMTVDEAVKIIIDYLKRNAYLA